MGEIAEMMLDGTMCQCCGEWLNCGEDGEGFPGYCASCQPDDVEEKPKKRKMPKRDKIKCPLCERMISKIGFGDHVQDAHYNKPDEVKS